MGRMVLICHSVMVPLLLDQTPSVVTTESPAQSASLPPGTLLLTRPGLQLTPTPPPASLSSPTLLSSTTKTASPLVSTNSSKSAVPTMEPPTLAHGSCSPTTHQT